MESILILVVIFLYGLAVFCGLLHGALEATTDTKWDDVKLFDSPIKKILFLWGPAVFIAFWLFGGLRNR